MRFFYCVFLLAFWALPAVADDDELRLLKEEAARAMERQGGGRAAFSDGPSARQITIEGETYAVGGSEEELARALYYALNDRQWDKVQSFLDDYRRLDGHRPHLVLMAEGLLARGQRRTAAAVRKMEAANRLKPDDVRVQLELARLYAEDNRIREAESRFAHLLHTDIPPETRGIVRDYLEGIGSKTAWSGSISIGGGFSDNINQSSGKSECVFMMGDECGAYRRFDKPVKSAFAHYSIAASRKIPLKTHHNILLRPLAYGTKYHKENRRQQPAQGYGENTAVFYGGYNFADADDDFALTPFFEHYYRDGRTVSRAFGAEAQWERKTGAGWAVSARAEGRRVRYARGEKQFFDNYSQYSGGAGASYDFSDGLTLFGSLDLTRRKYPYAASSNKEYAARIGAYKMFAGGFYVHAAAIYRLSRYDEGGYTSDYVRRLDRQKVLLAALGIPRRGTGKTYPELRVKHTANRSNAGFYAYKQNEISLNLRRHF